MLSSFGARTGKALRLGEFAFTQRPSPPKVNPLSFVPESLTQPGRESDRDVSMWTFSERRLRGMTLRCLVIVLALLAAFASDSWAQSKQPPTQSKQSAQPSTADQRGDRILMWGTTSSCDQLTGDFGDTLTLMLGATASVESASGSSLLI